MRGRFDVWAPTPDALASKIRKVAKARGVGDIYYLLNTDVGGLAVGIGVDVLATGARVVVAAV